MPYKSPTKLKAYLADWRARNPEYSRNYMRNYNTPKTEIRRRRKT